MSVRATRQSPVDEAERAIAVDPRRSVVVQAPAGSGKTTLLVERYLRLLALVDEPEEVLAITFTTKAATEMRERVLKKLNDPDDTLGRAITTRSDQRQWHLGNNPARLRIQTIDSFARSLAARLPLESGFDQTAEVTETPDALYRLAAARTLHRLYRDTTLAPELVAFFDLHDNKGLQAIDALAGMLGRREQWRRPVSRIISSGAADPLVLKADLESVNRMLHNEAVRRLAGRIGADLMQEIRDLAAAMGFPANEAVPGLARRLLTTTGTIRKKAAGAFPEVDKATQDRITELLKQLDAAEVAPELRKLASLPVQTLAPSELDQLLGVCIVLAHALTELADEFARQHCTDFTQIMLAAMQGLEGVDGPGDLALALDSRIQHILVDEFQDTSTAQFELFRLITEGFTPGDGRTFFAVGDPMQSIYGFRDADVARFHELQHKGIGNLPLERVVLRTNFRSDSVLVDWCNMTFQTVLGRVDDPTVGQVAFSPATAFHATTAAAVRVRQYDNPADEVSDIICRVQELHSETPSARLAILVRNRNALDELLPAMQAAGLPYQGKHIQPLSNAPIVQDILSLVRALTDTDDRLAWFAILRAPYVGLSLTALETLAAASDLQAAVRERAAAEPALARFCNALDHCLPRLYEVSPREVLERFLFMTGAFAAYGHEALTHAELCLQRIETLGASGLDADAVTLSLHGLFADTPGDNWLDVMTLHGAKGLEWDHVFLPFLQRGNRADTEPPLRWHVFDQEMLQISLKDGHASSWLKAQASERAKHERGRLLYVACTRARHSLHLSWTGGETKPPRNTMAGMLCAHAEIETVGRQETPPGDNAALPARSSVPPSLSGGLRRLPDDWRWTPPSVPPTPSSSTTEVLIEASALAADPLAAAIGDCVHTALARLADRPVNVVDTNDLESLHLEWQALCIAQGVPLEAVPDCIIEATNRIQVAVNDPKGRWLLGPFDDADVESEHTVLLDGKLVRVRFDRMFVDAGVRWIVDYKSTAFAGHPSGQLDLAAEVTRYRPQLQLYRRVAEVLWPEPVRTALYFTSVACWIDLD